MNIERVLALFKSSKESVSIGIDCLDNITKKLEIAGFTMEKLNGSETTGWQVDFGYYYNHQEYGRIRLSGSLWYGSYKIEKV